MRMGITFAVYGDQQGTEKIWPFDIVPRIVSAIEWSHTTRRFVAGIALATRFDSLAARV